MAEAAKKLTKEEKRRLKDDPTRLGRERVGKLLLEFAIPAILAMAFNTLYNIIDTVFLQQALGDAGAAVATLAFPVQILLMGLSMLAGAGGNALAAILMGEGKHERVEKTLGNTVFLLIVMGVLTAFAGMFFMDQILAMISTPADMEEGTRTFLTIICCGFILQSLGLGVNNFLRTAGKPNLSMGAQLLGTAMCIVLNYLFVMCWGWGYAGSAWATILGQGIGMLPTMWYFMFHKNAPFRLRVRNMIPEARLCGRILVMGSASFVTQVGSTCVSLVFNMVVGQYAAIDGVAADTALAALGIAMKSCSFAFTPMLGLMMAAQPLIGFNFGAKLWQRVLTIFKYSVITAMCIGAFFTILAFVIPDAIVAIFGIKGEGAVIAADALPVCVLLFCPVGFQVMGGSYFQSSGQPMKSLFLEMLRQMLFLIPMYLFMPPVFMSVFGFTGLESVVACLPCSDFCSIVVTTFFVVYEVRKVRRWRNEARAEGLPEVLPAEAPSFADLSFAELATAPEPAEAEAGNVVQ